MNLALGVLGVVLLLIAVRRVGPFPVAIWQAVAGGALVVLVSGATTPAAAWAAIDGQVLLFLFGMFVVGQALVESGYLFFLSYRLLRRVRSADGLLAAFIAAAGIGSAFLMNDTLAIIGTPLALLLARQHALPPALLLLALAFAVTTGSVMSPIGNPQNLLIALGGGFGNPFLTFLGALLLPTLAGLAVVYAALRLAYRRHFHPLPLAHAAVRVSDPALARLARAALLLVLGGVVLRILAALLGPAFAFPLAAIAILAAAPILLLSPRRLSLLRAIDWPTLIFFAALFVLMDSAWRTPLFQQLLASAGGGLASLPAVLGLGVGLSQIISNVPLVALYLPLLTAAGAPQALLLALAAASTLAGNLFLFGAASNVIIVQGAERRGGQGPGFLEFARVGVPITALQLLLFGWALG